MGKTRAKVSKYKNVPLDKQIVEGKVAKKKTREKIRLRAEENPIVDSKTSKKILSEARKQHFEINSTNPFAATPTNVNNGTSETNLLRPRNPFATTSITSTSKSRKFESDSESEDGERIKNHDVCEQDFYDDVQINEKDAKAFELFQSVEGRKTKKLSDIIMEKIVEKQNDVLTKLSDDGGSFKIEEIDQKVRELYENVRDVMKRYRSGKIPKAFKIIPKLRNWEQILYITEPFNWSAAAMFQGTRTFSSVLSQNMTQRFYNLVLLPRIRDDLAEYKRLNVHLYNALRKALFKPAAFMKGIILPLLESGDCSLREAIIFGSVIAKNSIPVLHSSACLLKICEMEYSAANSVLIKIFLDKRYALPYRVIDAAIAHFLRFEHDKREMPVLWHQSLLTFVQRYKNDISSEQKDALYGLLRKQIHHKITPEIRRELQAAKCRDVEMMEPDAADLIFKTSSSMNLIDDDADMD